MHTVKQILRNKELDEIWSVTPDATVFEAIKEMADRRAGALLVMEGDALKGIISERDYAREVILQGRASKDTLVNEIMSSDVISVPSNLSIEASLAVMTQHNIRHLPIVDNDQVVGVLSIGDLVKGLINEQQSTIDNLQNYIRG